MVFALLLSALIWNFATWYRGLPASSSHSLIGSIVGVGLMNAMINKHPFGDGVNWGKVQDTFMALLVSPIIRNKKRPKATSRRFGGSEGCSCSPVRV